mmetsp:Transcript_12858/g.31299  ORF Transcript_12858/g.31299 Transcript_12858/m.31299 type:complete len:345 (-) Transcript_12858:122-1156(-)|eukprot:CAMPEP_0179001698 /NCGR_PEP_ID=MMETSP0795-20121207/11523_1 /TAXON_ID=88552 /ORGANISM="Amoebophrya sp., Strain Ameob2" /LENGTH=344 /DNA_ID=CAMNT_0020695137 /DNA_START=205 /DNA_END=1239 /DNA_ORIENTATION=+
MYELMKSFDSAVARSSARRESSSAVSESNALDLVSVASQYQESNGSAAPKAKRQRTSKQMALAQRLASSPALLQKCRDALAAMVASSSSTTVVSQVVKFERILRASGQDPYPVSLEKVECFLAVGVASGYRTLDDDLRMICSRAKKAGNFDLSQVEESYMSSLLSSLRRKGFFNHDQKRPVFRRDILALSCRRTRASLLLVFYFGLRKSEASQVNSTIKVLWGEKSIGLDLRGAILKSNSTAAIRVRCFCDSCPEACLHTYWAQIEALSGGIDVVQCLAKLDAGSDTATHSFRVGLVVTLFEAGYTNVQIMAHLRWSSTLMCLYYARLKGLYEVPELDRALALL